MPRLELFASISMLVAYNLDLSRLMKKGLYDVDNKTITDANFIRASHEYGKKNVSFDFFGAQKGDDIVSMMRLEACYPSSLWELLFFGLRCPDVQRYHCVAALGALSTSSNLGREQKVVALGGDLIKRGVYCLDPRGTWPSNTIFLGSKILVDPTETKNGQT